MKKLFISLISLFLFSILLAGCNSQASQPLRLCVDLEKVIQHTGMLKPAVDGFLETVSDLGGPDDVEVEYIPAEGAEREAALTRIRNGIMAGSGPDIFIVISGNDNPNFTDDDPLFPFPEKSMENGIFYPLDDFLKNARFMEWDKLTASVMEAGRCDKGQMLLPLCYTFPVTMYPKDEVELETTKETTWEDMVNDKTGLLSSAANGWYRIEDNFFTLTEWSLFPAAIFGKGEDFGAEQLLFTQEELLEYTKQAVSLYQREKRGEFNSLPKHKSVSMAVNHCSELPCTMIPCYSAKGGVTATVTAFAGINSNTSRPEDSFFLLDVLLKGDVQEHSSISTYFGEEMGIPVYEGLMTEEHPTSGGWHMSDSNYQEFTRIRNQITSTRFSSVIDSRLTRMLNDCCNSAGNVLSDGKIEELVSETYQKLQMILAES